MFLIRSQVNVELHWKYMLNKSCPKLVVYTIKHCRLFTETINKIRLLLKYLKVLFWTYLCKDFLLCTVNCWVTRIFQSRQDTPTLHFQGKQYLNQCGMVGWTAPASDDKRNSIMFKWKMCYGRSAFSRKWKHWNKNSFAYEIKKRFVGNYIYFFHKYPFIT